MNKKISINNGLSTGFPINDTFQMSDIVSGKAFIDDKNAKNAILTKIKDVVTVTEFEILCTTNYRSDLEQIIKYHEIIGKLLQANVFNDINVDKL